MARIAMPADDDFASSDSEATEDGNSVVPSTAEGTNCIEKTTNSRSYWVGLAEAYDTFERFNRRKEIQ